MNAPTLIPPLPSDPSTVIARFLGALIRGEHLTGKDCWFRFSSSRAGHHAWQLRQAGWPIQSQLIEVRTTDKGRRAYIAEYWLEPDFIRELGEVGREFGELTKRIEQARRVD